MHCTDESAAAPGSDPAARRHALLAVAAAVAALAGCGAPPRREPGSDAASSATERAWQEFQRSAGRRLVAAHPHGTYTGRVPDVLFGIPVLETELNADGSVRSIRVLREPSNPAARDTVQLAMAAVRRAAPYGDMTHLARPWKWVEAVLFDEQRRFKPRALD
ncbi:MAG: hypothetical protein ACK5V2_06490 [Pseudomonadota bacterium]